MERILRLDFKCHQRVEDMISSSAGLYCPQCEKPVLNLSQHTRQEALKILNHYDTVPCIAVPKEAVSQAIYPQQSFWRPYRKSAALLALFVLLGNVKQLFAQTKTRITDAVKPESSKPIGYQKIAIKGIITDLDGIGIPKTKIYFSFLGSSINEVETDANGSFVSLIENYGGIREIDVNIQASGYESRFIKDMRIDKAEPVVEVKLAKRQMAYMVGGGVWSFINISERIRIHDQPDIFGRLAPKMLEDEITYLNQKLVYSTKVTDTKGNPIPNAKIEIQFPKNGTREGFTDESGNLSMHMQLDSQSMHANILVSAPGYHSKKVIFYEFDRTEPITHKLLKKSEAPYETPVTEETVVPIINNTQAEKEEENRTQIEPQVRIFPNPAGETVTIQLPNTKQTTVQLLDMNGRIVQRKSTYNQASILLDVKELAVGNYVAVITNNGNTYSEKIVIAR